MLNENKTIKGYPGNWETGTRGSGNLGIRDSDISPNIVTIVADHRIKRIEKREGYPGNWETGTRGSGNLAIRDREG